MDNIDTEITIMIVVCSECGDEYDFIKENPLHGGYFINNGLFGNIMSSNTKRHGMCAKCITEEKNSKNVKGIMIRHLEDNGFDGLFTDSCCCELSDLGCDGNLSDSPSFPTYCEPGYKVRVKKDKYGEIEDKKWNTPLPLNENCKIVRNKGTDE